MSKKIKTFYEKYKAVQEIGIYTKVPFQVFRALGDKEMCIMGDQVALSSNTDFVTMDEAREAVKWYVVQLGSRCTWSTESSRRTKSNLRTRSTDSE